MKCSNPDSGVWLLTPGVSLSVRQIRIPEFWSMLLSPWELLVQWLHTVPSVFLLLPFWALQIMIQTSCHSRVKKTLAAFSISLLTRIFTLQLSMEYLHLKDLQPSQARYRPQTEPAWLLTLLSHQNSILMAFPSQQMTLPSTFLSQKFGHHPCPPSSSSTYTQSQVLLLLEISPLPMCSVSTASALMLVTILFHPDDKPQPLTSLY